MRGGECAPPRPAPPRPSPLTEVGPTHWHLILAVCAAGGQGEVQLQQEDGAGQQGHRCPRLLNKIEGRARTQATATAGVGG
jgi:hypothetical protein